MKLDEQIKIIEEELALSKKNVEKMEITNKELMKRFLDTNWESKNFNMEGFFSEIGKSVDLKTKTQKSSGFTGNSLKLLEEKVLFNCKFKKKKKNYLEKKKTKKKIKKYIIVMKILINVFKLFIIIKYKRKAY